MNYEQQTSVTLFVLSRTGVTLAQRTEPTQQTRSTRQAAPLFA